jgi:hypothetical protein
LAFVLVIAFAFATELPGQVPAPASLTGRVLDQAGAPIVDALVALTGASVPPRRRTDAVGRYQFSDLPAGVYRISAGRVGFVSGEQEISLAAGEARSLDLTLAAEPILLQGVTAEARREEERERTRFDTEPGVTARVIEGTTLKLLPGLAEPDVLRAVDLLPGVISTSDFSSSYNVRGGSADQNLILIDGFTLFNPFHLGGVFSVFNSDAVARAELFAGGFGAEFGGRVSSVLNIESRSEIPESVEVSGGISMLATRVLYNAPLPKSVGNWLGGTGGSWFVSARRSYFDEVLRPVASFPYHLTDLQGNAAITTRNGGRLALTSYWGEDVLDLSKLGLDDQGGAADVLRIRWDWGNRVVGLSWVQPLSSGWVADMRLGYSRFADELSFIDFGDVRFAGRVSTIVFREDLSRELSPRLSARMGVALDFTGHENLADAGGTTFYSSDGRGTLAATYGSVRWRPSGWIIEPGARLDIWAISNAVRFVLSPRFAAKRFFGADQNVAAKLALGRYSQFIHSIRDEELPISNDTWVLANKWVPPVISDQIQLGIESFWGDAWSASAEAYYRSYDGVTEFNVADDPNDPSDDMLAGEGMSYGLDLLLRRSGEGFGGWGSLSLLKSERTFPDPTTAGFDDLPQSVTYPPIFDRRVNLDLVAQYTTDRYDLGLRWNFGSGLPYSKPLGQYFAWRANPIRARFEPLEFSQERDDIPINVVLGPRNAERYPAYHRLDLTIRRTFERSWGTYVPYLQILNLYNRKNVLFYFYDYNQSPPRRSGFSMFPLLPAIGVEVTF